MRHLFRLLRLRSNTTLAIDITSTSVKLLELSRVGEQYYVENYARQTWLDASTHDGMVSHTDSLVQCLRRLLKNTSLSYKHAILSIPDSCTISKIIQVSERLRDDDLEELVLIEVDKHIPHSIDEINFDFKVLGPSTSQTAMRDVLIVACRAEHINHQVNALRLAGLRTKLVDIESHAIQRVLQRMVSKGSHKTMMLLDVGAMRTKIFVFHEMKVVFVHEDAFGGNQLLSITPVEGVADKEHEPLLQFRTQMLSHVKRALQFFYSSHPTKMIDDIVLAGGVAKQADLAVFLQDKLRISTRIVNPFATMLFAKHVKRDVVMSDAPMLMTVCGLALRA